MACARALAAGDAEFALARFDRASQLSPSAPLFQMDAVMALPAFAEWRAASIAETWIVPEDEADWPTVLTA